MDYQFITLKNEHIEVTLCNLGASINRIIFDNEDMILTPCDNKDFFKGNCYYGKTIGRICGRIKAANEFGYALQANEGTTSLHGGFDGLSSKVFKYKKEGNKVTFTYLSKDEEAGYPGNLNIKVTYELVNSALLLNYECHVDKPCVIALTNHTYFCLGEKHTDDLSLIFDPKTMVQVNEELMPVKHIQVPQLLDEPILDLSICGEIDNYFQLDNKVMRLFGKKYAMDINHDFEGVNIFTDHWKDMIRTTLSDEGFSRGVAIEPQDDQLNRKVLLPNDDYRRYIIYTFKKL